MKEQSKAYAEKFEQITGIKPKSARMHSGSMKHHVTITLEVTPEIKEFVDQFYKTGGTKNLNGVEVDFMGSVWQIERKGTISFDVKIANLA